MQTPMLRRSFRLIAFYTLLSLAWIGFSRWVAPKVIAAAYFQRGLPILNRFFETRRQTYSLDHYSDRWSSFAFAILLAIILHLGFVLTIRRSSRRSESPSSSDCLMTLFSAMFLASTVLMGARGDYGAAFGKIWKDTAHGDPWWLRPDGTPLNAYGPLFNALAPLAWINPLAPKLFFASAYVAFVIWLIRIIGKDQGLAAPSWRVVVIWLANPYPWMEQVYWGNFDILIAFASVLAVHARLRGHDIASGITLGAGILLKYMPIVLLPFLVMEGRHPRYRLLGSCIAVVVIGHVLSVAVWGTSTFRALIFAFTRESMGGIFGLLSGPDSALGLFWESPPNLDWLALPCLLAAGLTVFYWHVRRHINPVLSSPAAVLAALLFYQSGLLRYQMTLFLLVSYWAVTTWDRLRNAKAILRLVVIYFFWIAIVDLLVLFEIPNAIYIIEAVTFLLGSALLASLVVYGGKSPNKQPNG